MQPNSKSSMKLCMAASGLSYLGLLNGAMFRAEPEQSQIGIKHWMSTVRSRCLSVTYGMTSSSTYYYTKAMTDLFVNTAGESGVRFQSIGTMADFWTVSFPPHPFLHGNHSEKYKYKLWLCVNSTFFPTCAQYAEGPLLDGLYWTKWYNNQSLDSGDQSFIYYENMLLGVPRMRQIKIKNNSCKVHDDFQDEITGCFDVYNEKKEEELSFGLINGTA